MCYRNIKIELKSVCRGGAAAASCCAPWPRRTATRDGQRRKGTDVPRSRSGICRRRYVCHRGRRVGSERLDGEDRRGKRE